MSKISKITLGLSLVCLTACGNPGQSKTMTNVDSVAQVGETTVATETDPMSVEDNNADFKEMEQAARLVFAMVLPQGEHSDDFEDIVVANCTPSFIDALKRENDFDDGSVAWWALRTLEQEGPEDNSEIVSIMADGTDAVIVNYSDMGHKGSTRLAFIKDGDKYKINSATMTYKGESRTIK